MKSILMITTFMLFTAATFANAGNSNSSPTVRLSGFITDNRSNETLAGAAVYVDGKKYYSDLDGNFSISGIKAGKQQIRVELISYEPVTLEIDATQNEKLNISLPQKAADTASIVQVENENNLALAQ